MDIVRPRVLKSRHGLKGFLKWLQREQPGIYKAVAAADCQGSPAGILGLHQFPRHGHPQASRCKLVDAIRQPGG